MMKLALLASTLSAAAAFAPASQQSARVATVVEAVPEYWDADFSKEPGVTAPLGVYDPLKFLDGATPEVFADLREKEIKHGRVAMLAVSGYLYTAAGNRFPGAEDIPDGLAAFPALAATKDGQGALIATFSTMLLLEICMRDAPWSDTTPEFPGDYRNGVNGFGKKTWDSWSPETKLKKRTIELNNGRAAMMGIWGLVTHEMMGVSILPGSYLPGAH